MCATAEERIVLSIEKEKKKTERVMFWRQQAGKQRLASPSWFIHLSPNRTGRPKCGASRPPAYLPTFYPSFRFEAVARFESGGHCRRVISILCGRPPFAGRGGAG